MEFFFRRQLLSPLLICTLFVVFDSTLSKHRIRHHRERFKRQQETNSHPPNTYVTSDGEGPDAGPWSDWSTSSQCSRTCGGGVATQYRQCHPGYRCNGPSRRHFSCNTQECPDLADFRSQQCSEYDGVPFEGIYYQWIPYTKAPNPCELNCMPRGERFYYRHKDSVIDGTPCNDEKLDVCVEGVCQPVGCDMMLGSSEVEDKCRHCGGDGSMCNTISGVSDMQDLIVGYNDILLIPIGATNIFIEEVAESNNYLAVRNTNSQFYLNGNWSIDFPRTLEFAGCKFHYGRSTKGFLAQESLRCLGPTNEPLIIVLLFQNNNIGIQYEYSIPKGIRPGGETQTYAWKYDDFIPCSKTCGGGVQYRNVTCAGRKTLEPVDRNLCDSNNEPAPIQACNEQPCEPQWAEQEWEECSTACGTNGIQKRKVYCQQIIKDNLASIVVDKQCSHLPKPQTQRPCNQNLTCPEWHIEPWKPCDHICGIGAQTRKVTCFRKTDGKIEVLDANECIKQKPKPSAEKKCYLQSCEGVDWITSTWSGCENKCGLTYETREVICASQKNVILSKKQCDGKPMPESVRQCVPNQLTCYMWYASEWSECSAKCGNGVQTRTVFCGSTFSGGVTKVDDKFCDPKKKYETRKTCTIKKELCPGEWFTGPWSPCSKECGGGQRTRQIVCLKNQIARPPTDCDMNTIIFSNEECNPQSCDKDQMFTTESGIVSDVSQSVDYSKPTPAEIVEPPTKENRSIDYEYEEVYDETCEDGEWVDDEKNNVPSDTKNDLLNDSPFIDEELMLGDEPAADDPADSENASENDENGSGDSAMEGSGDYITTDSDDVSKPTTTPSSKSTVENIPHVGETDLGAEKKEDTDMPTATVGSSESPESDETPPSVTTVKQSTIENIPQVGETDVGAEQEEDKQPLATSSSPITDSTEVTQTSEDVSTDTSESEGSSVSTELQSSVSTSSSETEPTDVTDSTITVDTSTEASSSEISSIASSESGTSESEASTESKPTESTLESGSTETSASSDTEMSSISTDTVSTSETVSSSESETEETETSDTSQSEVSTESSSSVETQSTVSGETELTSSSVSETSSGSSESSLSTESEMTGETSSEGPSVSTESSIETSSSEESTKSTDTSIESSSEKTDSSISSESTSELTTSSQLTVSEETGSTATSDTLPSSESTSEHTTSGGETGLTTVTDISSSQVSSLDSSTETGVTTVSSLTSSESSAATESTVSEISSSLGSSLSSELSSTISSSVSSEGTEPTVISSESSTSAGTESTASEISSSLGSSSELPSSSVSSEGTEPTVISSEPPTSVGTESTVSEISSSLGPSSLVSSEGTESTAISSEPPTSGGTESTVSEISSSLGSSSELPSSLVSSESTESTAISSEPPSSGETESTASEISSSLGASSELPSSLVSSEGTEPTVISSEPPTSTGTESSSLESSLTTSEKTSELSSTISSLISTMGTESTVSSEAPTSAETELTVSEISSSLGSSSELPSTISPESTESTVVSEISSSLSSSESTILSTSAETEASTVGETSPSALSSLASSESTELPTSAETGSTGLTETPLSTISSLASSESSSELSTESSGETSPSLSSIETSTVSTISETGASSISTVSGTESSISSMSTVESSSQITGSSTEFTSESTESASTGITDTTVTSETQTGQSTEISTSSESSGSTEFSSSIQYTSSSEISASTPESAMSSEFSSSTIWDTTSIMEIFTTKKLRKCRKKVRKDCKKTQYGCCVDKITPAKGPFNKGCPDITTCEDTPFGCCEDKVSVAMGKNFKDCPVINCTVTLFGCCADNKTVSQGNDYEGCPLPPPKCIQSLYGCCNDNVTEAKGPNKEGCVEEETSISTEAATDTSSISTETSSIGTETSSIGTEISSVSTELSSMSSEVMSTVFSSTAFITFTTEEPTMSTEIFIHCSQTPYHCCPDNVTTATGPNYKGCQLPCEDNQFGCCENGVTPAHGPSREGCCLMTPHGCCPDNIRPAQGPNLEGCGCEYSPYRCCPDNVTSARGYYNEGCGCQYTAYGCCPDKHTEALGPNFYGCACHTFQFGCCPDGVTVARGSYHQGCGCRETEFGCCSDEKTPATGPNMEGCECASSKYGCCLDGETEAQGDNFEGCKDVPVKLQASCKLEKKRGSCKNYTVKWFFDTEYGGCSRFWYGGCEGNDNRFKSKEECEEICVKPTGIDICSLPKVSGACEGYYPMWYYDNEQNTCAQFVYSGCLGNNNKFETKEECAKLCVRDVSADPCEQPREEGPCRANYIRWHYDKETGNCDRFIYGGCKANNNNFLSESECKQQCAQPGHKRNYCSLPKVEGNCAKQEARWYFESSGDRCMPFYYSGCDGNNNNFLSQQDCEASCPREIVKDTCLLPAEVGECGIYTERWYYDTKEQRCRQFYYGGCGGNTNNFETEKGCQERCQSSIVTIPPTQPPTPKPVEPFRPEFCFLENDVGPCREYDARWYYDRTDGACKQFMYGGCPGNGNNFLTDTECEEKCGDVQDLCGLPPAVGPCKSFYERWHYNPTTDSCETFNYGGCLGNKNRFDDKVSCERRCKKYHPTTKETEITHPTIPTPAPTTTSEVARCYVSVDAGNCSDSIPSYYYDPNSQRCLAFVYTGCGGNANRYYSEEQCERQCGKYRGQDVCRLPRDAGPCRGYFRKFYYDSVYGSCGQFVYGGCDGNGNRFSSQEECEYVCVTYEEKKPQIINETASVICRLPLDVGACREGYHKHFYFDDSRGECVPFIYSGCGGNFNNFKSFQTCVDYCREFMAPTETVIVGPGETSKEEQHPCQQYLDQCGTLLCEYGPEAFVDEETLCTRCRCHDPCRDIDCGADYQCAVDINRNRTTYEDPTFIAVCRQVNKDGDCPQFKSDENRCEKECGNDADCALDLKCCSTGCGSVCVAPIPQIPAKFVTLPTPAAAAYTKPSVEVGFYPPKIDEKRFEPEVNAGEGDYATLDCSVQGNPTPTITWKKGNLLIDGNQPRYRLLLDGALQIITLHKTDSGLYLCAADNGIGHPIEHTIKLEVTDSLPHPTFIVEDNENSVVAALGAPTTLHCYATGYPFPAVTWWKDDSMIPLHTNQFVVHKDYSLHINSVQLSNLGIYTCQAYNGIGKAASWSVTVQALGPVYSTRPEDVKYMQYVINPPERPTTPTTQSSIIFFTLPPEPIPQPQIPSTTQTDPVPLVPDVSTEGHVVYQVPVKVNITQRQTRFTAGRDISLGCDVEGYPIPLVIWYKNGQPIYPSESVQISESHRLHITGARVADSGEYQCEAVNPYSRSVSSINIVVEEPYIHPKCTDSPYFANCELIVKAQYCEHKYYARFCCKSCTEAGQLPPIGPHLRIE